MKQLLVTVGTTKFENLIKSIDDEEFYRTLERNNFTDLIIQKGTGAYIPYKFNTILNLRVRVETLLPNFEEVINQSEYIISHAGAGVILESLKNNKTVIVCVNDTLMDNHQIELAESLCNEKYVYKIKNISEIVKEVGVILSLNKTEGLQPYPKFDLDAVPNLIYSMLDIK